MIDTHCHLDFAPFDPCRDELLSRCPEAGVDRILIPGVAPEQWSVVAALCTDDTPVSLQAAAGLHPWWVERAKLTPEAFSERLRQELFSGSWVAIGECGLDGNIHTPLEQQQAYFVEHLRLAVATGMPLILHGYKAHNDILQLLVKYRPPAGGVIHGFSGSLELALQYWRLGFYIGVGGTITYPRAAKTRKAVAELPLEALLLETDAPDMPLFGHQGQPNSPLLLPEVAQCLAQLRNEPLERVIQQTTSNAERLFGTIG